MICISCGANNCRRKYCYPCSIGIKPSIPLKHHPDDKFKKPVTYGGSPQRYAQGVAWGRIKL